MSSQAPRPPRPPRGQEPVEEVRAPLVIRFGFVAILVALALWKSWPLSETLTLGLDLQGGVHMELEVDLDEAVRSQGERTLQQVRDSLRDAGVSFTAAEQTEPGVLQVTGVSDLAGAEDALELLEGSWDVARRGSGLVLDMVAGLETEVRTGASQQVRETIERRINEFGVAEPVITRSGEEGERIVLQLPGLSNADRAKKIITTASRLEFRLGLRSDRSQEALLARLGGTVPDGQEILLGADDNPTTAGQWFLLEKAAVAEGPDLVGAQPSQDLTGRPTIGFTLSAQAGQRFGEFTSRHRGEPLAVVLDGRVVQYANIQDTIFSRGHITGSFSIEEVQDACLTLRSGSLPAKVTIGFESTVGPFLGAESIKAGTAAAVFGFLTVVVFIVIWYLGAGINALVALFLNLIFVFGALSMLGATLTLPGIAGLILTIGMAVDANVIIFERIREEIIAGKTPKTAVDLGFDKAWSSIMDANLTTLLAAFFLFNFGTGPIKGFAVTLALGILASMFTAVFVSRALFDFLFERDPTRKKLSIGWRFNPPRQLQFMRFRAPAAVFSAILVLGGCAVWMSRGLNYGIDFQGGTQVTIKTAEGVTAETIRQRLNGTEFADVAVQPFGEPGAGQFLLRVEGAEAAVAEATMNAADQQGAVGDSASVRLVGILASPFAADGKFDLNAITEEEVRASLRDELGLDAAAANETAASILTLRNSAGIFNGLDDLSSLSLSSQVKDWLGQRGYTSDFTVISSTSIGPAVGEELREKAGSAIRWSLAAILLYITVRFELRFGVAAIIALVHDVLVTLGVFAITGREINLTIVAALMTIVGYSLNDTIVVFDRMRENLGLMKRKTLEQVIDGSLSQTLGRTLLTSGTTLFVVLSLLVQGGAVLRGFALALTIGVLIGTYSSIFVASPVVLLWERFAAARRKRQAAAEAGATA